MHTETIIVGAGLAGLSLAAELQRQQRDYVLIEARERLGGRIFSKTLAAPAEASASLDSNSLDPSCFGSNGFGSHCFDLGPTWFWPQVNPRMKQLVSDLGLGIFPQYQSGGMVIQSDTGFILRQNQSWTQNPRPMRINGGMQALIHALAAQLDHQRLRLACHLTQLELNADGVTAQCQQDGCEQTWQAQRVVIAVPPRVALRDISFTPALPKATQQQLQQLPTWMASRAKMVAVYSHPFWRDRQQSGLAISQCGPLAEIHDASPADGSKGALFAFFHWPAEQREAQQQTLKTQLTEQLVKLYGPQAGEPEALWIQDWAQEPLTAVASDLNEAPQHPSGGDQLMQGEPWQQRLLWAASECGGHNAGYLEGALEAAAACLAQIPEEQTLPMACSLP